MTPALPSVALGSAQKGLPQFRFRFVQDSLRFRVVIDADYIGFRVIVALSCSCGRFAP